MWTLGERGGEAEALRVFGIGHPEIAGGVGCDEAEVDAVEIDGDLRMRRGHTDDSRRRDADRASMRRRVNRDEVRAGVDGEGRLIARRAVRVLSRDDDGMRAIP